MKKGAIHIDWVISIGIFLVYIIVLLVLIKPNYEPAYEEGVLTTMIKDEFLEQNKIDAGFVVFKAENCQQLEGKNVIEELKKKIPSNIDSFSEINIKSIPDRATFYKAYYLDQATLNIDSLDLGKCENVEIGEIMNYNGLKNVLNFDNKNFKFPSSRSYKITIYPGSEIISTGEPSGEAKVYVLDWSSAKLNWDNVKKEITRDNIIINIQVW